VFDADRPIISSSQDRLNRSLFAKYLARCMLDHKDPESLVVGLYGGWGVGKTSLINMVLEELNFAATNLEDVEKPVILNFSAWSYSGQQQLIYSFFRRLSSALRNVPYLENSERIIYLLELYVSFFTHQPVPKALRLKKNEDIYGWESGRDLTQVKAELNDLLRLQQHKIIIMIDNISRLYDEEIKEMFKIVKSMGDFVNTSYLLSFDKEQVVTALDHLDVAGGEEFIEKIVQLPFVVPPILQQDLEKIFSDRLSDVLVQVPEGAWSSEYWADIYYSGLKYFFTNCRDITRYVNTLTFSYSRLRDVVNPVDFFALTAIEVFLPEVYFGIRDNKDLFTDLLDNVYRFDAEQVQKDRLRCDEILSRSERIPQEILLDLLIRLFPRLRKIYEPNNVYYYSDSIARKLRRIASPDLFDVYFRLSLQTGQIPYEEFETLLKLANNAESFDHALTRLNQDDRILKFLDMLDSKILQTIPQNHIQSIVSALIDNGDLFPAGLQSLLSLDTPMRLHRIIHNLLRRLPTFEERFLILQTAIGNADKSLYSIVHELQEQLREHSEENDTFLPLEFRDLTPDQLDLLCKLAVSRIESWANNESLDNHPRLVAILYAWLQWSDNDACRHFVKKLTDTDKGLVSFLTAIFSKAIDQAMCLYERTPMWEANLQDLAVFIPPKQLEAHAKQVFEDDYFEKLGEREQLALMIFLDLLKANTEKVIPQTSV